MYFHRILHDLQGSEYAHVLEPLVSRFSWSVITNLKVILKDHLFLSKEVLNIFSCIVNQDIFSVSQ